MLWTKYSLFCLEFDSNDISYPKISYYEGLELDDVMKSIRVIYYVYFTSFCTDYFDFYIFTTNISYLHEMYDRFHPHPHSYYQITSYYIDNHFHQHRCNDFYHAIVRRNKAMLNFTIKDFFLCVIMSGYD